MNAKKKKLLYKSWNRGCKETDIIIGEFAKDNIDKMSEMELDAFKIIVEADDGIIYDAATRKIPVPEHFDAVLFDKIVNFSENRLNNKK